jgi:uncharacterized membrane protein YqhA
MTCEEAYNGSKGSYRGGRAPSTTRSISNMTEFLLDRSRSVVYDGCMSGQSKAAPPLTLGRGHKIFEQLIWNSRYLVMIAVVASLLASLGVFLVFGRDTYTLLGQVVHYIASTDLSRAQMHATIVAEVAGVIDGFLFATVLLIFGLGLYELFIDRIHVAERSEFGERILLIRSVDDLKDRLAKVVFLILVVRYFEYALQAQLTTSTEILQLAAGIMLIALALFLTSRK